MLEGEKPEQTSEVRKETSIERSLRVSAERLVEFAKKVEKGEILPKPLPVGYIRQNALEIDPSTQRGYTINGGLLRFENMAISLSYEDMKLIGIFTLVAPDGEEFDIDPDDYEWLEDLPDEERSKFRLTYFKEDLYLPPVAPRDETQ